MIVILPAKRHSLDHFVRQMSSKDIKDIMEQLSYGYRRLVHLTMPKFEVQSSFSLVNVLLKVLFEFMDAICSIYYAYMLFDLLAWTGRSVYLKLAVAVFNRQS